MNTKINFDPYDFSQTEISSVPVYYKNLPWANCIFIRIVFKVGALDDPIGKEGLAHFLEHMMFDGSESFPDRKSIVEWKKNMTLNTFNASTGLRRTEYNLKCIPENFEKVMTDLNNIIWKPFLKEEFVESERQVITQECWQRYKNEKFLAHLKEVQNIVYPNTRYGKIIIAFGFPDTISSISKQNLKDFYENKYVKENMFIILTGKIDEENIKHLNLFFKDSKSGVKNNRNAENITKPSQNRIEKSSKDIGNPQKQTEILKIFYSKPFEKNTSKILIWRNLIYEILMEKMRYEKNLCYSLSLNYNETSEMSSFYFLLKTDTKNIKIVEDEFQSIITDIYNGKYEDKFATQKRIYLERIITSERLSDDIADDALNDVLYFGKIKHLRETIEDALKVEFSDMQEISKKIFTKDRTFTKITLSEND